jgi:hypothetical protein
LVVQGRVMGHAGSETGSSGMDAAGMPAYGLEGRFCKEEAQRQAADVRYGRKRSGCHVGGRLSRYEPPRVDIRREKVSCGGRR